MSMITTDKLRVFEQEMKEIGSDLREVGQLVDEQPERLSLYTSRPSLQLANRMMIPPEYGGEPIVTIGSEKYYGLSCIERVTAIEQLAYGDAGTFLGCPGPSMSGIIINELADSQQKERFYSRFLKAPSWTFFALSEPKKGSDATGIQARVHNAVDGDMILNGEKYFIGNGCRADMGLVFAQTSHTPLGIQVLLIDTSVEGFSAVPLDTMGVRAVQLSHLTFNGCRIEEEQVLGRHLSKSRRGFWGALQTFHQMRPGVAALGLGVAQAAYDYLLAERTQYKEKEQQELEKLWLRLAATRSLIRYAAMEIDADGQKGYLASLGKIRATQLAEEATQLAADYLGPGSLYEHPLLNKWYRDARAFEFMEGTTNIQKVNVFQAYITGKMSYA